MPLEKQNNQSEIWKKNSKDRYVKVFERRTIVKKNFQLFKKQTG